MCKRARFLASLLAETETATEPGIRKSAGSILRQDVSADIFLLRGGMEGATLPALPVLQARFWCPRKQRCEQCLRQCNKPSYSGHLQ